MVERSGKKSRLVAKALRNFLHPRSLNEPMALYCVQSGVNLMSATGLSLTYITSTGSWARPDLVLICI